MHFGSDNQCGASPQILAAIVDANRGFAHSYGDDPWTRRAIDGFKRVFDCDLDAYFVATGTAANSLALACMTKPWELILCHEHSHILNDESTAPEFLTNGARLVGISQGDGKLDTRHLLDYLRTAGSENPHAPRARVLSVTQASEDGLVYEAQELAALCMLAHRNGLIVHMDGARFANAVAAQGCAAADLSSKAGVDVLSLGATKNGAYGCEAVIFFNRSLASEFEHRRKRAGNLLSKSRIVGAQFAAWFDADHWLELARHANAMARRLSQALSAVSHVRIAWPTEANEVFAILPTAVVERLRAAGAEFYDWPKRSLPVATRIGNDESYVRLVTSFATQAEEVERFCEIAASA